MKVQFERKKMRAVSGTKDGVKKDFFLRWKKSDHISLLRIKDQNSYMYRREKRPRMGSQSSRGRHRWN